MLLSMQATNPQAESQAQQQTVFHRQHSPAAPDRDVSMTADSSPRL